jgi:peptidoglycan/LPS O-acetylase OafA/YrhL
MKNNVFQIMRGVCIIAVVLTHIINKNSLTNPYYEVALVVQNIVNCAVTGFIFLVGYFINIDEVKSNAKYFIIRKSKRILIPYILWTIFYIIFTILHGGSYTYISLIKTVLLGYDHLYYCILYFLFILITPFVIEKMENKIWNIIFYSIMPVWFIIVYYLQINYDIPYSNWGILPVSWFLYFYMGMKMKNKEINIFIPLIGAMICLGFFFELMETHILLSITNNTLFSTTPLRFSTVFYVFSIIILFLRIKENQLSKNNILVLLGNNSFGIYLSHIVVLIISRWIVRKIIIPYSYVKYILFVAGVLLLTISINYVIIIVCKRIIPQKLLKLIGFL